MAKSFSVGGVARIRHDSYGSDWRQKSASVQGRYGKHCMHPGCTETAQTEVHHIQPLSRGGMTVGSNLLRLCQKHHAARHGHLHYNPTQKTLGFIPGGKLNVPTLSDLKRSQRNKRRP